MNGLKDLKINGLKNIRINGLKDRILNLRHARDTDIKGLTKRREDIKKKVKDLVREKKEIESRIIQLQKTGESKEEGIYGSPWQEKKRTEGTDNFEELKKVGEEEKIGNIGKKTEVTETKPDLKRSVEESNGIVDLNNNASKKVEEIIFQEEEGKTKIANFILQENKEEKMPEKSENENEKPASGIFGSSLIEELMESEDLCPEEEQSFMKYIEESSVTELVTNLKEIKELLA